MRLNADEVQARLISLPGWEPCEDSHHIFRKYTFPDFQSALAFTNRAGVIAEQQGHHPDLLTAWGRVEVKVFTHSVNGLTEKDFVLARAIEEAFCSQTSNRFQ